MSLEECYNAFGGDYQDVKSRLQSDELLSRLVVKFLSDKSYERLCDAVREENYDGAFRAAHTLKGVSQNLSFERLSVSSSDLTELLRNWESAPVDKAVCEQLFSKVSADYKAVADAINEFAKQ